MRAYLSRVVKQAKAVRELGEAAVEDRGVEAEADGQQPRQPHPDGVHPDELLLHGRLPPGQQTAGSQAVGRLVRLRSTRRAGVCTSRWTSTRKHTCRPSQISQP